MRKNKTIYPRLAALVALRDMEKKNVADACGISYNSLHNKMSGKTEFTLSEAIAIKEVLKFAGPLERLFETNFEEVDI